MPAVSVHHTATTDAAWDADVQVGKLGDDYTEADLKAQSAAWLEWGAHPDGWISLVHGEIVCRA